METHLDLGNKCKGHKMLMVCEHVDPLNCSEYQFQNRCTLSGGHQEPARVIIRNAAGKSLGIDSSRGILDTMSSNREMNEIIHHDDSQSWLYCYPDCIQSVRSNSEHISTKKDVSIQTEFTEPRIIVASGYSGSSNFKRPVTVSDHVLQTDITKSKQTHEPVRLDTGPDNIESRQQRALKAVNDKAYSVIESNTHIKGKHWFSRFFRRHIESSSSRSVSAYVAKPEDKEVTSDFPTCLRQKITSISNVSSNGNVVGIDSNYAPATIWQLHRCNVIEPAERNPLMATYQGSRLAEITKKFGLMKESIKPTSSCKAEKNSVITAMDGVSDILTKRYVSFRSLNVPAKRTDDYERLNIVSCSRPRIHIDKTELILVPYYDKVRYSNNETDDGFVALSNEERCQVQHFYECIGSSIYVADSAATLFTNSANATSELTEWKRLYVGVPVWLFNTGMFERRPRCLQLILSEIGTGFTLIDATVDRWSELRHPTTGYITFRTKDKSSVIALKFFVASASESFMFHLTNLKKDHRNRDVLGSNTELYPEKSQQGKNKKHRGTLYAYTTQRVTKKAISRPISFTHITSLRNTDHEKLYSMRTLL